MKLTRKFILKKIKNNDKDFSGLDLSGLDLSELDLSNANLYNANLFNAILYNANLYKSNLSNANLENANLKFSNLENANLENANLSNAYLKNTNLTEIKGKKIIVFHYNKHFSYYCDGILKIGCELKKPQEWLECYQKLGKKHNYTEQEIEMYLKFINICKDLI